METIGTRKDEPRTEFQKRKEVMDLEKQFSVLFEQEFAWLQAELGRWSTNQVVAENPIGFNLISIDLTAPPISCTTIPKNQDACSLEPATAGHLINKFVNKDELEPAYLVRYKVGLACIQQLIANQSLKPLISILRLMLDTLKEKRGYGPEALTMGLYGTFKLPGLRNSYGFLDPETASLELRLYSNCQRIK